MEYCTHIHTHTTHAILTHMTDSCTHACFLHACLVLAHTSVLTHTQFSHTCLVLSLTPDSCTHMPGFCAYLILAHILVSCTQPSSYTHWFLHQCDQFLHTCLVLVCTFHSGTNPCSCTHSTFSHTYLVLTHLVVLAESHTSCYSTWIPV